MKNIFIVNYAFLKYYYTISQEEIDFKNKVDREKLVTTTLMHSNIEWRDTFEEFKSLTKKFYKTQDCDLILITNEILRLVRGCLTPGKTENISDTLRDVLVDLNEKIDDAWSLEIRDEFKQSSNIWKEILSDDFPLCDEKLVEESFYDKRSPYFIKNTA